MRTSDLTFLAELEAIVRDRFTAPTGQSYTAKLAAAGRKRIAQKVGEEGVELALAAVSNDRDEIVDETADLLYHVIVLLVDNGLSLADVVTRLEERHAARP